MMRCLEVLSFLAVASASLAGCDKSESHRDEAAAASDAGKSKVAVDEPDLANAVESVRQPRAGESANNGGPDGPPPTGIFAPGAADKAMAKGAPAALTLGSDGSAPRIQLGPVPKPGTKRAGSIEVATQSDPRQGAIPISLALSLEAQKAKAESDAGAASAVQMVAKVTGATINAPGVPAEIAAGLAKLKGSHVDYQLGPDGAGSNFRYEATKGVDPAFKQAIEALSDTLVVLSLPFPSKPVGVGAYWMITTRDSVMGLDVVTYRLLKLEKLEGNVATLNLSTKRYAASPSFDIEGLPPDAPRNMGEFRAQSDGTLTIAAGDAFPKSGQLDSVVAAGLGAPDPKTKQRAGIQVQTRATIAF